ncbi:chloride channel protein [Humibacter soli]
MTDPALRPPSRFMRITDRIAAGLRGSRAGLFVISIIVGVGAGLGAVLFRYLVSFFTWVFTGQTEFGQDGWVGSTHLPWLGLGFLVVVPVIGGLLYGPLVYRFAREARGHGVPEVMIAVAENGGRIRPQVSVVKALASAITIGTGGSVGREGPIVQIGSALASTLGQWIRMPENRMRILVACGAGGGIAATFNAPITGVFFGVEIILREMSVDALFAVMLSAMVADAVAIPFLGNEHFLTGFPAGIVLHDPRNYLLIAGLAVIAALIGLLFKTVLYGLEDLADRLWKGRPEWLRPAVGGLVLGLVLLALPQMYGVGYPVMFKTVAGDYALWFLLILAAGKILATSISLAIGGSGGIFAPSLFIGVTSGMAFGVIVDHLFGPSAGNPALYAVVAMGAVFASAARAPLTSFASVVEMTGDFTLTLPVMLAVAIATAVSRGLSYGTIYTTKLLRRGQDIDRAAPWRAFADLTAAQVMRPLRTPIELANVRHNTTPSHTDAAPNADDADLPGTVTHGRDPQAVFATESITDVLRQLDEYGRDGLPVLSDDGRHIQGWITNHSAIQTVTRELGKHVTVIPVDEYTGGAGHHSPAGAATPLTGYQLLEVTIPPTSPVLGKKLGTITWPPGHLPVSYARGPRLRQPDPEITIAIGDRINLLTRTTTARDETP